MKDKYLCYVSRDAGNWHETEEKAIEESHRLARKESLQCFILKAIAVTVPHSRTNYIEDGKMTMKRCDCAECDDFKENKPAIKPNKERYEQMLREQWFGVKRGEDGVAEVKKEKPIMDNEGFMRHVAGDPMPCDPRDFVRYRIAYGFESVGIAGDLCWQRLPGLTASQQEIVAWKLEESPVAK